MDVQLAKDLDGILSFLSQAETDHHPHTIKEVLEEHRPDLDIVTIKSLCRVLLFDKNVTSKVDGSNNEYFTITKKGKTYSYLSIVIRNKRYNNFTSIGTAVIVAVTSLLTILFSKC